MPRRRHYAVYTPSISLNPKVALFASATRQKHLLVFFRSHLTRQRCEEFGCSAQLEDLAELALKLLARDPKTVCASKLGAAVPRLVGA